MEQLSLIDKFKVLFDNIFEHPLFIIILLVPAIIFLLQKKHGKKAFVFVYLLVIVFVLYIGGEVIFELFDNLMNGLFMTLYFPNFITLFVVVVLCSAIALISFFSKKMFKINKIINITGFAIIQMLFVLILTIVRSKNINIYADNALYSNNDVLTLMQLLIGTFALQVISILIINGINKVTDILDKKSTPLAEEIKEQITTLEKTKTKNTLGLIKNIKIDNTKVGYINVADKSNTSKPKLKPFKFDVDKLESVTLNVSEEKYNNEFEKMFGPTILEDTTVNKPIKENTLIISDEPKPFLKEKIGDMGKAIKNVKNNLEDRSLKKKRKNKDKGVLLPKEKSEPISSMVKEKPDLFKPMEDGAKVLFDNILNKKDEIKETSSNVAHFANKFIKGVKEVNQKTKIEDKPDLLKHEIEPLSDSPIKVISEVERPKLVREMKSDESTDLVDNLNILDIQSTLDTVIKYKLMIGVNLQVIEDDNDMAVDNLQIPNFDMMMRSLRKSKLYKKI